MSSDKPVELMPWYLIVLVVAGYAVGVGGSLVFGFVAFGGKEFSPSMLGYSAVSLVSGCLILAFVDLAKGGHNLR